MPSRRCSFAVFDSADFPKSRAFYVTLGKEASNVDLKGHDVTASNDVNGSKSEIFAIDGLVNGTLSAWTPSESNPKYGTNNSDKKTETSPAFKVNFFKDKDGKEVATNLDDAKYAQIVFANAAQYIDGETYTQTGQIVNDAYKCYLLPEGKAEPKDWNAEKLGVTVKKQ